MPLLSVIVPVADEEESLEKCVASLRASTCSDYEILVADDGSADEAGIARIATHYGARVVRLSTNRGPAVVRNAAVRVAAGEVLVFIDVDVMVHKDALERIAQAFRDDPALDALIGSYDLQPKVAGTVAAFRNLLHAHVHHRSAGAVTTFWAGCGAVRRRRFEELGGFQESYRRPSIEDVEFGMRLHRAGGRLVLDPAIQVTHRKEWTLLSMVHTDTFRRAMPWTEIAMQHGLPHNLNFRWRDRLSVMAAALMPALAFLAVRYHAGWSAVALAVLGTLFLLQLPLFGFLARQRGVGFSAVCFPLYLVHLLAAAAGFILGLCRWEFLRDRWLPWVIALLAVLIFGAVQAGGGAYTAEFDSYPDEAAHFMTGLMLRDFMVEWPLAHPVSWVEQYYLHYPKVALMHWPPLFHLVEAVWWLFLPPSRFTGVLLMGLLGLAAAVAFYRLARQIAHPAVAAAAASLLVAVPVVQQSASQTMAEPLVLLFAVLAIGALARGASAPAALWCALCLMVKGNGACLVPALLLCLHRRRAHVLPMAIALGAAGLWFAWTGAMGDLASAAGLKSALPWNIAFASKLAGPGFAILAAGGVLTLLWKREPLAIAASAVAVSTIVVSFFLRAMNEPRHWIVLLPSILLLSLVAMRAVRAPGAVLAAIFALALFPWSRYQQHPAGYAQLAAGIRQPARMLVSTAKGWREGSWIVLASLREARPSSVIVRATKVLARSSWSGGHYELRAATPAEAANVLDRLGIETVILDNRLEGSAARPHHVILRETVATNSAWQKYAASGELSAWRRVRPPSVPRQPLKIRVEWGGGRVISER